MPQMFQVLRCYKCLVFQVHQTKKANKFECKMCGEQQSIKRHYGLGNGQECRKHVQKLNGIRGEMEESKNSECNSTDDENEDNSNAMPVVQTLPNKPSKWSEYSEKSVETSESHNNVDKMYLNDKEIVFELPNKRRKILGKSYNRNQSIKTSPGPMQSLDENYVNSSPPKHASTSSGSIKVDNLFVKTTFKPPVKKEISMSSNLENSSHNNSSLSGICNELDTFSSEQTEHSFMQTNYESRPKNEPPPLNKNSKWAKFAEDIDINEEKELEKPIISENNSQNDPHTLFSLCDDNELDAYLTI